MNILDALREDAAAERWFGDGPPHWLESKNSRPGKTASEVDVQRVKLVSRLEKYAAKHGNVPYGALAHVLRTCRKKHRCFSGACPCCTRAVQRVFVAAAEPMSSNSQKVTVSLIDANAVWTVPQAGIIDEFAERLSRALAAARVDQAYGGFDVSANESPHGLFAPHFQVQTWFLIDEKHRKRAKTALKRAFPRSTAVPRPLHCRSFDGSNTALAYALKHTYARRLSIPPETVNDRKTKRRDVRYRPLRATQECNLAWWLHLEGLNRRVFLHGLALGF